MALVVKNTADNAGDTRGQSSVPGSGRSSGVGNVDSLQYYCLENSIDRGARQAIVHGVAKSQTQLVTEHNNMNKGSSFLRWNLLLVKMLVILLK